MLLVIWKTSMEKHDLSVLYKKRNSQTQTESTQDILKKNNCPSF